jgi:hypothetical protein
MRHEFMLHARKVHAVQLGCDPVHFLQVNATHTVNDSDKTRTSHPVPGVVHIEIRVLLLCLD